MSVRLLFLKIEGNATRRAQEDGGKKRDYLKLFSPFFISSFESTSLDLSTPSFDKHTEKGSEAVISAGEAKYLTCPSRVGRERVFLSLSCHRVPSSHPAWPRGVV